MKITEKLNLGTINNRSKHVQTSCSYRCTKWNPTPVTRLSSANVLNDKNLWMKLNVWRESQSICDRALSAYPFINFQFNLFSFQLRTTDVKKTLSPARNSVQFRHFQIHLTEKTWTRSVTSKQRGATMNIFLFTLRWMLHLTALPQKLKLIGFWWWLRGLSEFTKLYETCTHIHLL